MGGFRLPSQRMVSKNGMEFLSGMNFVVFPRAASMLICCLLPSL